MIVITVDAGKKMKREDYKKIIRIGFFFEGSRRNKSIAKSEKMRPIIPFTATDKYAVKVDQLQLTFSDSYL